MNQQEVKALLMERAQTIEKRKNRLALFLFILPVIYFLLNSAVIKQIEYGFIKVSQIEVINIFTPIGYSIMIFYFVYLNEDLKALKLRLNVPEESKEEVPYFFSHQYLAFPPNLIFELLRNMKHKNLSGEFGTIFIFSPVIFILLFGPLLFLFYSCYYSIVGESIKDFYLNYISAGLAIWVLVGTALYSYNRKKETERLNLL